jgi:N-acetylneuraminic acid mutarotase
MRTTAYAFLLSIILLNGSLKAQTIDTPYLKFTSLTDMPYIQEWPAAVTDGKYIYSVNGYSPNNKGTDPGILKFDPNKQVWTVLNKQPPTIQSSAAYVPNEGLTYIFGGLQPAEGNTYLFVAVQSLNLKTGELKTLPCVNPMATSYGYAVEWHNKVYVFGGTLYNRHTTNLLYCFDPKKLTFAKLANMPYNAQTAGVVVKDTLYTVGGYSENNRGRSNKINAYDFKTDTWKTVYTMPTAVSANSVAACGDMIFIVGNYTDETYLACYNTRTGTFRRLRSNMENRRAAGALILNHTLYVFGGKTQPGRVTGGVKSVQMADVSGLLK